jgi:hypothetical protein
MSTQHERRRPGPIRRRAALATAVITALALAAPVGGASAGAPRAVERSAGLFDPAFLYDPAYAGWEVAYAGNAIGDVFNGGTTVVVSTAPAQGNTIGSP